MGWFFACDHGVVGRCPVCGSLAEPHRATDALRRQADQVGRSTADPRADAETAAMRAAHRRELTELADEMDAEQALREGIARVLARDAGRTPWWQRLRSS
jgi:hypothetical protein